MEIKKPNDILVATIGNPRATTYDLKTLNLTPDNTSLYSKEDYKQSDYIKEAFKNKEGKFDDVAFDNFYNKAAQHYMQLTNEDYIKEMEKAEYSPFDETRPTDSKVYNVDLAYTKEINPFQRVYGRRSLDSVEASPLSLREIAQQGKIYDSKNKKWLEQSSNDRTILKKFFGETLVYAQWDDDGEHQDPLSGFTIKHNKGDWKINPDGELYVETLGNREIYGKQVLNPMDILTTDGSIANKFDFFDNDNIESSATKATIRLAAEIAPLLIPWGVGQAYAGVKAAVALSSVMPTFYKALEGILLGDSKEYGSDVVTAAEGYMAKFAATSSSDQNTGKIFTYEGMTQMVGDIFGQIYEQRAAASLAKIITSKKAAQITATQKGYLDKINKKLLDQVISGKIDGKEARKLSDMAMAKLPELASFQKAQSGLAKSLSLGYMALTSTGEIYGEALDAGYDRRTAGFAAMAAAAGQYGVMMNNRMGDWFLDETTGYTQHVNRALLTTNVKSYLKKIEEGLKLHTKDPEKGKKALGLTFREIKNKLHDVFTSPTILGEQLFKNAVIEGVEEVTEELVLDATKGIVDVMSYLGLTAKKGSFNTVENVFSAQGAERYLASLLGGLLGGTIFEFHRTRLEPWMKHTKIDQNLEKDIYELVANGQTEALIAEVNKQRSRLGNKFISPLPGEFDNISASPGQSQADIIADVAINMIKYNDGIINSRGLALTEQEILDKTIRDHLVIEDLRKARGDNKIGIEGIIIEDYKDTALKIVEIVKELELVEKNSDKEKELKETLKELETKREDIISGKNAMDYFNYMSLYFNNEISKDYIITDRVTYVQEKYNKNYYTLPATGTGLTKESVNHEFKEYMNSLDIKEKLKVATNYFTKIEGDFNKSLSTFVDSNYAEHRKIVQSKVKSLNETSLSYLKADQAHKQDLLTYYINTAKEIEALTKSRVMPWEAFKLDISEQLKEKYLYTLDGTNVKKVLGEQISLESNKDKLIDSFIEMATTSLPAEQFNFNLLMDNVNEYIRQYNEGINKELESIVPENDGKFSPENLQKIADLNSKKLNVQFGLKQVIYEKHLKLPNDSKEYLEETAQPGVSKRDYIDSVLNRTLSESHNSWDSVIKSFNAKIEAHNIIVDEEIKQIQNNEELSPEVKGTFVEELKNRKIEASLEKQVSDEDFFTFKNYAIDVVLSEIKAGNLDGELLKYVEKELAALINPIKNLFKDYTVTTADLIDLLINFKKYEEIDEEAASTRSKTFDDSNDLDLETSAAIPTWMHDFKVDGLNKAMGIARESMQILEKSTQNTIKELWETIQNKDKFISNSIYDYLEKFELYLNDSEKKRTKSIFQILRDEELTLFKVSDISSYLSEDVRDIDITQALNVLKLFKGLVSSAKTTELDFNDPYGFLIARQNFAKRNKIDNDVLNLKTITSDIAELALKDLVAIEEKLKFLQDLSKANSSKTFIEQEITREKTNNLLLKEFTTLFNSKITYKDREVIPNITDILESKDSVEKKLLNIKEAIFENNKKYSATEKAEIMDLYLTDITTYKNQVEHLGTINRDIVDLPRHYLVMQLGSALSISSKDLANKLRAQLKTDFDKSPFFTQEVATEIAYASLVNPEVFAQIANKFGMKETHITDFITYIMGGAGVGKTSVIFKSVIALVKDANPNMSIWFAAPNIDRANGLRDEVSTELKNSQATIHTLSKKELFEKMGLTEKWEKLKKDIGGLKVDDFGKVEYDFGEFTEIPNDLPDLIFIDEITHFNALELSLINSLIRSVYVDGKFTKIIAAGDLSQNGALVRGHSYNIERVSGVFPPILSITIRPSNVQQRVNNDALEGLTKYAIKAYRDERDTAQVLKFLENKLKFRYYKDANTINGALIIPELNGNTLEPIKNALAKDPKKKLGVMVTAETKEAVIGLIESIKINPEQVIYFTPDNIQGSETDFFIFNTGIITSTVLPHKLKSLYTYMSRAKSGTVVIKDVDIPQLDITNTVADETTEYIQPLSKAVIEESKEARYKVLTEMLDPDFSVKNNFVFGKSVNVVDEVPVEITINENVSDFPITKEENDPEKTTLAEDAIKYLYHTFYNDLNVKVEEFEKNGEPFVRLYKSNQLYSGLNILLGDKDTVELEKKDFDKKVNDLIRLKYSILNNISKGESKLLPNGEEFLVDFLGKGYKKDGELVLRKSTYFEEFNKPYQKFNDAELKHLKNGDTYTNIYLKVTRNKNSYYIHLATAPKIETLKEFFNKNVEKLGTKYPNWKSNIEFYENFLKTSDTETPISPEVISFNTGTRLVKQDKDKKVQYTLSDLNKIVGISFWDVTGESIKPGSIDSYNLFPTNKERFKEIIRKTDLGKNLPDKDLDEKFENYKNRPYIAVSFTGNPSHIRIIVLNRKTRTVKEVSEKASGEVYQGILKKDVQVLNSANLIGSPQVLHLLVNLAVEKPNLFNSLFKEDFLKEPDGSVLNREDVMKYYTKLNGYLKRDIISHVAYEKDGEKTSTLRLVIEKIAELLETTKDKKEITTALVKIIKESKNPMWAGKFWNIFKLPKELDKLIMNEDISKTLQKKYSNLSETLFSIFNFWGDVGIYHNVNIKGVEANGDLTISRNYSDHDNLFTEIIPEGPRLLIDFNKIVNSPVIESKKEVVEEREIIVEPEVIEASIPSIANYALELQSLDSTPKNMIDQLNSYLLESTDVNIKESIINNWTNLYQLLESNVTIKMLDGTTMDKTFKELTTDEWNLYPSGDLIVDNIQAKELININNWMDELSMAILFEEILKLDSPDIWNC